MVIIILTGGLLFIYFNIKLTFKINLTSSYIDFFINIIIFKKNKEINKRINYNTIYEKFKYFREKKIFSDRYKDYQNYLKYSKYPFKIFMIKNLLIYKECHENQTSLTIEFYIVNKLIKRSLLNH